MLWYDFETNSFLTKNTWHRLSLFSLLSSLFSLLSSYFFLFYFLYFPNFFLLFPFSFSFLLLFKFLFHSSHSLSLFSLCFSLSSFLFFLLSSSFSSVVSHISIPILAPLCSTVGRITVKMQNFFVFYSTLIPLQWSHYIKR